MRTTNLRRRTAVGTWNRAGFTLIEIIVVVAVLSVLAGAAVPVALKALTAAARKSTRDELAILSQAANEYFRDTNSVPKTIADLEVDPKRADSKGWAGPYVPGTLSDPATTQSGYRTDAWSRAYTTVSTTTLKITSAGEGGIAGDTDDISIVVDFTPMKRTKTLELLTIINQAVVLYNAAYQSTAPLPKKYSTALSMLVSKGFLPDTATFAKDAWGSAFVGDPSGKAPMVKVKSANF